MKNKKNHKKLYIKIEKRQRSCGVLQKGDGLFISLEAFCGLLWLKISNIGTARTYRMYIVRIIIYNMRVIRKNGIWGAFYALYALFSMPVVLYQHGEKNALKRVI